MRKKASMEAVWLMYVRTIPAGVVSKRTADHEGAHIRLVIPRTFTVTVTVTVTVTCANPARSKRTQRQQRQLLMPVRVLVHRPHRGTGKTPKLRACDGMAAALLTFTCLEFSDPLKRWGRIFCSVSCY
jgi:hypothetical protein